MHYRHTIYRLLTSYLLIAFVVVQSLSGLLHVDLHSSAQEPDVAHHHYPAMLTLDDVHTSSHHSNGMVKLDLQHDSSLTGTVAIPLFALLFAYLILISGPKATRTRIANAAVPLVRQFYLHSPPLRAPPRHTS